MKKSVLAITGLILPVAVLACSQPKSEVTAQTSADTQVQPATAEHAKGLWIDVRSAEEYSEGHLSNAINIAHTQIGEQIASVAPNKDEPIHLYCRSGRRAEAALQTLKSMGYTNVTNHGAYDDLVKQGLK
ncbi:rhodanese-like domain-containing protein [Moraxella nasicaprae]|uniref:Rhodanese-like domain-containing protein n=1 Tax=Moraxella nasicaprae TaxID=2904122 RepID=A0ABY6F303_9GAMM|nr:rhodanese-like domain-containing protein [Moraxella nasicaprae]UXZ04469.1 rhodanese-like domain-containing protein [Moraxella nasicaprae]